METGLKIILENYVDCSIEETDEGKKLKLMRKDGSTYDSVVFKKRLVF